MSKPRNSSEEPDFRWLEECIVSFCELCLALLVAFATIGVNLVCALFSAVFGRDDSRTDE